MSRSRGQDRLTFYFLFPLLRQNLFYLSKRWGQGPTQAPPSFNSFLVLIDALVHLQGLVCGAPSDGAQFSYQSGTDPRVKLVAMAQRVEVPITSMVSQLVVSQLMVAQLAMSSKVKKMLGRFQRLVPHRFQGSSCKEEYDFLISCKDWLQNYGLNETHGVDYTTFKLNQDA